MFAGLWVQQKYRDILGNFMIFWATMSLCILAKVSCWFLSYLFTFI